MKIALLQINPIVGDLEGNVNKVIEFAKKANGSDLIITSELALLGYPPRDLLLRPDFIQKAWKALQNLANDTKSLPPVLIGTATFNENKRGKPLFNCAAFLKDGKIKQIFHKSLLPTYDVFDEDRYFEPSDNPQILTLRGKKIGVSICEDLWNDRNFWKQRRYEYDPVEKLAEEKVDLIINLSSSPFTIEKQQLRQSMIQNACKKYKVPIIYVNQVGGNDDLIFDGASLAFDRNGKRLARSKAFEVDLIVVDLDSKNNAINDYPQNTEELILKALTLGLSDYLKKCGFKKVLIGISGGIDSAVVTAIASHAVSPRNVIGVLMPSPYTPQQSMLDAKKLAKNLDIKTITINISKLMREYNKSLKNAFKGQKPDVTEENIQSRIRGNLLMALSNKYKALVLSTGNKSELTVGYTTLYGDLTGGLAPVGDLSKTQVYKLAKWINREEEIIPKNILIKPPSAELKPDQKDQDTLPPYNLLDKILYLYIEKQESPKQIISRGFKKDLVNKVLLMIANSEFKRRQAPPTLKVTGRAFGSGWRMPIAASQSIY